MNRKYQIVTKGKHLNGGKPFTALLLAIIMAASLSGCTQNDIGKPQTAESPQEEDTSFVSESPWEVETEPAESIDPTIRNSVNMLNYMTSLTQKVNAERGNQLFLEATYNSFDNLYPNAVDKDTQVQITDLMDTIKDYRMIGAKRDRLAFIYEQNRAQALRQAIPNPVGLLGAVNSKNMLKTAAAVLYMAVDSATSYTAASSQADRQFIEDGWELDDEEVEKLHTITKNSLSYLLNMVRKYNIPGDYTLSKEHIENFVEWSNKTDSELERKVSWFEANVETYGNFGPFWLELAKDYYNYQDYEKCLAAVKQYEAIATRIFRKDLDYAKALPMAILSARETMSDSDYVKTADRYCEVIYDNTEDEDWALRYFAAQVYLELYSITNDLSYLDNAYAIARENVVVLVDEQTGLNASYLADVKEIKADKGASKRKKKEIKQYNSTIKKERKIALPPVSEALYLNCDLLFALANEKKIDDSEKKKIEAILHVNGDNTFLSQVLDDRFWFDKDSSTIDPKNAKVSFDGETFSIPASFVTDRATVSVSVSGSEGSVEFDDWTVKQVKRPKKSKDCSKFTAIYQDKNAGKYKYQDGEEVTVTVTPVADSPEEQIVFAFNVASSKKALVFKEIEFERVK